MLPAIKVKREFEGIEFGIPLTELEVEDIYRRVESYYLREDILERLDEIEKGSSEYSDEAAELRLFKMHFDEDIDKVVANYRHIYSKDMSKNAMLDYAILTAASEVFKERGNEV